MSLRARLLLGMAVVAAVLALAAVATARTMSAHLLRQVDDELRAVGPALEGRGPLRPHGPAPGGNVQPPSPGERGPSSIYVAVIADDGTITPVYTPNLTAEELSPPAPTAEQLANAERGRPFTVAAADGTLRYRALVRELPRLDARALVATPIDRVTGAVARLVFVQLVATLAVIVVLGLVTWWVLRLGVRPIKQMTATATAIAGGDLSHRVPDVAPGTEAGDLGAALNRMLGRIEDAFAERVRSEARLRQFVGDASHELRTPVTTIRGYAELARSGALEGSELQEAMRRTEQEAVRMGSLVDDLLRLARLDQGRPLAREPLDLGALAEDAVRDALAVDPDRPITADAAAPVTVLGDEGSLRQVVGNLVGNALAHTRAGTPVAVRVAAEDGQAVLEVADQGPGMAPEDAARAFERFYRADPSRSRHRGGSGLGLAIVEATVRAHGGRVTLDSALGRGTTVRVELPGVAAR